MEGWQGESKTSRALPEVAFFGRHCTTRLNGIIAEQEAAVKPFRWSEPTVGYEQSKGPKMSNNNVPDMQSATRIRQHSLFDGEWYLKRYPDVEALGMDPAEHFIRFGAILQRDPGPQFNTANYLERNPEAATSGVNPLLHFMAMQGAMDIAAAPQNAKNSNGKIVAYEVPLATDYALRTLAAYKGPRRPEDIGFTDPLPRISFVMTSYNAQDTIEDAVHSLLRQNYPDLEVIVCDDRSTDRTWDILRDMQSSVPNALKVFRVNVNGGTYLAKNIAIANATGDIVMFQDSDDYSHPERTMIQVLPLLQDPSLVATRSKYMRFDPKTGKVIPVADLYAKFGLITLAVRRQVFEEMGYFDAVRKAGDDEWVQRLAHIYGKEKMREVDVALYMAELRENSLVADMLTFREDGSVDQAGSKPRKDYVAKFRARFADKSKNAEWYRNNFHAYPLRPNRTYPETIASLAPTPDKVVATACCIPKRIESFKRVVDRLLPQVDELHVYLDKFETVPDFLSSRYKVVVTQSQNTGSDLRDNAKFEPFNAIKARLGSVYYITCDDDILYPHDYVRTMIDRLRAFDNKVVAGVHGVVCEEQPRRYFRRRFIYHFQDHMLAAPRLVNNLGTGTVAFHSSLFDRLDPADWPVSGMVDIYFSKECRKRDIPMLCIDRHARWICETEESIGTPNLFTEFNDKEKLVIEELSSMTPWGYAAIRDVVRAQPPELVDKLQPLIPRFSDQMRIHDFMGRYR
ncbi:glycosyltransferase family 2 protein [Sulfitobacter aestuarii]|uniref:Glycosyltransferase family 2 protein n=1 Tax=Sulfitobacter aestuarii TaxID=2161676 RepID=A0ABW5U9Y6_9RHOB